MDSQAKKIRWKCRRGTLELDLIFLKFYEKKYPHLSAQGQKIFEQLLDEDDLVLTRWILGTEVPSHPEVAQIIAQIVAQSRQIGPHCCD